MFDTLLDKLDLDGLPPEAIEPIVDYCVLKILSEWNAGNESRPLQQPQTTESHNA
jgi:hypothetical protein